MGQISKIIDKFSVLKQLPIFSKLKWFELQKVAVKCSFFEFKKGELICKEGTPADGFYCIVSGRVQAFSARQGEERRNAEFLHRGMYFGIISLLTGETHSLSFEAINDSVILKIEKDDFSNVLDLVPRLGIEFSHSLSRRLRSRETKSWSIFESNIISIYSPVKASGSSTYAINLALSLERETKKKVIFVSINSDQNGKPETVTSHDASPKWTRPAVALKDIVNDHQRIRMSISRGDLNIAVLSVTIDPQDFWLVDQISHFVSILATDYHFIVVDLPNEMDDVVFKTLTQSDTIHLITKDASGDLKQIRHVIERLRKVLGEKFNKDKMQVVISGMEQKCYLSYEEISQAIGYDVFQTLPHITSQELSSALVSDRMTVITPDPKSEYAKSVRKIARRIGGVLVGLVLGGGAALGIAHVGVIRVLEKENIPIDVVVGSSIGALIAALWAVGKNANELETIAREFENRKASLKLVDLLPSKSGLSGHNITRWLRKHLGDKTFYSTRIPFKAIAYDLVRREELVVGEGSLVDAVRASIAIPGVISPIVRKGRLIIDGGVVNPLPTNVVSAMGIKKIIAINVLQSPSDVVNGYEVIEKKIQEEEKIPFRKAPMKYLGVRAYRLLTKLFYPNIADIIVRSLQAVEYVIAEQSSQQADVLIHPDLTGINWFELYQVDRLIKSGEEAAYRHLPEIRKLINE